MSARPAGWRVAALGLALAAGGAWQAVVILVLLTAVLWADEATEALTRVVGEVRVRAGERRELDLRRLELLELQPARVLPVPCAHEQAVPVPAIGGTVVAWLCPQCDAQLPQDFSACGETR